MKVSDLIIRPARVEDAAAMVRLLNAIIEKGGTTAMQTRWQDAEMVGLISGIGPRGCVYLATDRTGPLGFQYVEAHPELPEDTGDIATFVALPHARRGVGAALARATLATCKTAGWRHLNATIRADNVGGLAYYTALGFREYRRDLAMPLADGTPVDRISKRLSLVP